MKQQAKIIEGRDAVMDIPDPLLRKILGEASRSGKNQTRAIIAFMIVLAGGGGSWMVSTETQIEKAKKIAADRAAIEARREERVLAQEIKTERTAERLEDIAVYLVQQGRYVEDMVRAVSPKNAKLPPRPPGLDAIERDIQTGSRRGQR
jgi:hypothetical protein